ncbi:hypothetical protein TNCV_3317401 [Trichonephila clavipes]|nr:hypothetical protein TNCV_3317401 [Trichonephila clavipes]
MSCTFWIKVWTHSLTKIELGTGVLDMQDGRGFVTLHKQVARVLHQSRARIETDRKTRGQRRQFGIQNVKDDIGSHQF